MYIFKKSVRLSIVQQQLDTYIYIYIHIYIYIFIYILHSRSRVMMGHYDVTTRQLIDKIQRIKYDNTENDNGSSNANHIKG